MRHDAATEVDPLSKSRKSRSERVATERATQRSGGTTSVSSVGSGSTWSSTTFWPVLFGLGCLAYLILFLRAPIAAGVVYEDGTSVPRAAILFSSLLAPDAMLAGWFGNGQLERGGLDRVPIWVGTAIWLLIAFAIGRPWLRWADSRLRWLNRVETISLAMLLGLACLSTVVLVIGLMGGLSSRFPLIVVVGMIAIACVVWDRRLAARYAAQLPHDQGSLRLREDTEQDDSEDTTSVFVRWMERVVVVLTCCLALMLLAGASMPPNEFDVLEYHLQVPREFFQNGRIQFLPHNIYGNMPLGFEMHSLAAMTVVQSYDGWLGGLVGKCIIGCISLVGAALLGGYVSRRTRPFFGWIAAGFWLAAPGNAQVAMLGLIDSALATYVLASAYAVEQWLHMLNQQRTDCDSGDPQTAKRSDQSLIGWTIAVGCIAGGAAAAKYPGLVYGLIPAFALVAWHLRGRPVSSSIKIAMVLLASSSFLCGIWFAKNWIFTGNPFYPLAANLFGGETLTPEKVQQWQLAHRVPGSSAVDVGWMQAILEQIRLLIQTLQSMFVTGPQLHPALALPLLVSILLAIRSNGTVRRWLLWSGWIMVIWWFATHRIDRFWLPVLGLWCGAVALGALRWKKVLHPIVTVALGLVALIYGSVMVAGGALADNRYFISLDALHDDPLRTPPAALWVNTHLKDQNAKLLLIGEAAAFQYEVPIVYSTCFDKNAGETWLRDQSIEKQRSNLQQAGITHLLVNWNEIERYRSPGNYGFSDWPQRSDLESLVSAGLLNPIDVKPAAPGVALYLIDTSSRQLGEVESSR